MQLCISAQIMAGLNFLHSLMKPSWEIEHGVISLSNQLCKLQLQILATEKSIKLQIATTKELTIQCDSKFTKTSGKLDIECETGECLLTISHSVPNPDFVSGKDFGINLDNLLKCTWDILVSAPKNFIVIAPGELERFSREADDLFYCKQTIPISLSSIQIIRGQFECIRLFNQKPNKEDGEEQIADQSKIDVFFLAKDRKFIQSSCFYLPQVWHRNRHWIL